MRRIPRRRRRCWGLRLLGPVDAFSSCRTVRASGCTDSAIFSDLGESGTLYAVGCIAELPEFDMIGDPESLQEDGDFVGVWARVVGVQNEGFDIPRHFKISLVKSINCSCQDYSQI